MRLALHFSPWTQTTILSLNGHPLTLISCRSVPTRNDILVPETQLKKRKSQEKEREAKAAEIQKRKAVSHTVPKSAREARWRSQ